LPTATTSRRPSVAITITIPIDATVCTVATLSPTNDMAVVALLYVPPPPSSAMVLTDIGTKRRTNRRTESIAPARYSIPVGKMIDQLFCLTLHADSSLHADDTRVVANWIDGPTDGLYWNI